MNLALLTAVLISGLGGLGLLYLARRQARRDSE